MRRDTAAAGRASVASASGVTASVAMVGSRCVRQGGVDEAIAAADHRLDERLLEIFGHLAAEGPDGHAHGVGERIGVLVPDVVEQMLLGEDLARTGHEV